MSEAAARPDSRPIVVLLNGRSGRHETQDSRGTIERLLAAAGREHQVWLVESGQDLPRLAREAVAWAQPRQGVVVAAGGDGTINGVAQVVLGSGCCFGVLPQGTFNYFGRTHGISQELEESVQQLLDGQPQPVQAGLVNHKVFLVNASLGLYPQLLEDRETMKQKLGRSRFVALLSAIKTLSSQYRQLRLSIEHLDDGQGHVLGPVRDIRTPTLFVGNNRLQFEQIGVAEGQVLDQGRQLAAIALRPAHSLALMWLLVRGAFGRLGEADQVVSFGFRSLTVELSKRGRQRRVKVATDGEIVWMSTPLRFSVAPQPLMLVKPLPATDTASADTASAASAADAAQPGQ